MEKMQSIFWLLLVFVTASSASLKITRDLDDDAEKYLLPWNIRPEHYDLTLFTHIEHFENGNDESFLFMGIVEITLTVLYGDVSEVVLHIYDDIQIVSSQVTSLDVEAPLNYNTTVGSYDPETNKQIFTVDPPLSNNDRYRLTIYYIGNNSDSLRGFYRSSFTDENGNQKWLLTTHFESFGARRAFPSFDEPEYKATFKLIIHYNQTLAEAGYTAFFNTEIESETIRNGAHITTFKTTTRPLSTYLVAFILAPFKTSPEPAYFNSSFNGENPLKPLRTIGQPKFFNPRQDLLSQVAGPAALNTMTKLTGVGFGLDKVEQAGIPDFGPGAMENWGLVTYRQDAVFFDPILGTTAQKESVVSTITHELAHQWFGDLVTLYWWSDVWLNEGFATFFATHASNEYREPDLNTSDWNLLGKFVTGTLQGAAFKTDASPNSRPLTAEAYNPDTIDGYFDNISYSKGGCVLRMWLHLLGPEIFYSGLNRYLRQQQEGLGTPEILLASWDGVIDGLPESQKPALPDTVAQLFFGWHVQAGYPVISVARQGATVTVTQERFLSSSGNDSNRWNVPLSYSTDLEPNFDNTKPIGFLLASETSAKLQLKNASANWIVLNNQETGYYRVNYDSDNWDKLIAVLNDPAQFEKIHEFNRAQILDDAANLGASTYKRYLSYDVFLRLLPLLRHERTTTVWEAARLNMMKLLTMTASNTDIQSQLKNYFAWLVQPTFSEISMNPTRDELHSRKRLRMLITQLACFLEVDECKEQAADLAFKRTPSPDVKDVVLCEMAKRGELPVHIILSSLQHKDDYEVNGLLKALSCQSNEVLTSILNQIEELNNINIFKFLNYIVDSHPGEPIVQDVLNIIKKQNAKAGESKRPMYPPHLLDDAIDPNSKWLKERQSEILVSLASLPHNK